MLVSLVASGLSEGPAEMSWAGFSAPLLRGGNFVITGQENHPSLVVFLALAAGSDQSQSRAASVVLSSISEQYGARGLRVVVVDESSMVSSHGYRRSESINRAADWNLTVPILEDEDGRRGKAYLVRVLPTTVLIAGNGCELARWVGYTRTPIIARSIEEILGGPLGATPRRASEMDSLRAADGRGIRGCSASS